jgi:propionate CoA-transferase
LAGVGGFVNIAQNARKLVFCGTFTTGGLAVAVADGKLQIVAEGRMRKFVREVEQIGFAADLRYRRATHVLFVTERAVFQLCPEGIELIEIAPGIELERDILSQMEFRPVIRRVVPMPDHCFQ